MFKVQKNGISYPSFDPDTPWDQCTPVLGMKFETPLQLKNCLANYGVKNGYQLWYMQNDSSKLLVKCGRDVSKGKCAGMKGKKPNPKPSVEEPKVGESSKQGEKGVCSEKADKGESSKKSKNVEHYSRLWEYRQALMESNLNSRCQLDMYENDQGQLLTAMGRDANNQMFPIAWAVVSMETKNNWCWFLSFLHEDLSLGRGSGLTIISDAHKGLIEEIKLLDVAAFNWLVERNPNSWSRTYLEMDRCTAAFENGISESFNSRILGARGKPIITMLEDIRIYLMQRMWHLNKKASELEDTITPSIRRQLEHLKIKQIFWLVFPSAFQEVEVRRCDEDYGVNLNTRKCSCRMWELSGTPCVHAVAAYTHMKMEHELGVRIRHPTENDHEISRRRRVMHCHKCLEVGHNKSTCTNLKIPKPSPSTAADGGTETPVPKPTSLKTVTAAKTRPPSSTPVIPPEGPPEPRISVVGRGKCQLKPINKSGVGNTMAKNHGKATITKNQAKEYQMEMDYEALAAVEAKQATKDAD
ncbi:splicing factor [Tanacetum coccineum]